MGSDWYKINTVSAIGFFIDPKKFNKSMLDDLYGAFFTSIISQSKVDTKYFVYDKRTVSLNNIEIIGPYEIEIDCHVTEITQQKHLDKFYNLEIQNMKNVFNTECCYFSIITTMGLPDYNEFNSVKEYKGYYGYDEENKDEEECECKDYNEELECECEGECECKDDDDEQ